MTREPVLPKVGLSPRELDLIKVAGFALAYFLAHEISFFFPDTQKVLMAVWPAGGIGLAALLLSPRRLWPALIATFFIAGNLANLLSHRLWLNSLGFMTANTLESLGCAWVLVRWCGESIRFTRVKEIAALFFVVAVVNGATALIGAGTASLTSHASFWGFWKTWWIADGLGILLVAPFIVSWSTRWPAGKFLNWSRIVEAALFLLIWVVTGIISSTETNLNLPAVPRPYFYFALLAWPALRFGNRSLTAALVILSVMVLKSLVSNAGVFILDQGGAPQERLLLAQIYLALIAVTGYLIMTSWREAKTSERSLLENERFLSKILDTSAVLIYIYDLEKRSNVYANRTVAELLGYTESQIQAMGESFMATILPPDELERVAAHHASLTNAAEGEIRELVYTMKNAFGELRILQSRDTPFRKNEKGETVEILGVCEDITERKGAEEDLRKSEERYRGIVQLALDGFWRSALDGRILQVNDAYCRMSGYTETELLAMNIADLDAAESASAVAAHIDKVKKFGSDRFETRHRRKDGGVIDIEISVQFRPAEACTVAFLRDITARKWMEASLRASEEKFRNLFYNAGVAMFRTRVDGSANLDFNDKFLDIFGCKREEMQGNPTIDFWADPEARATMVRRLREEGTVTDFECKMLTKEGSVRDCLASVRLYGEAGILEGSVIDITDRKRAEEALQNAQKLDALGALAGGIAHDFNNLLGGIFGYIDLAMERSEHEEVTAYLTKAMTAIERTRGLTRQLLTFAKGGAPVRRAGKLFPFVRETAQFALSGSNVSCTFDVAPDLRLCDFDRNQIGQVIDNVVINAQQAMPLGGTIELSAENVSIGDNEHPPLPGGEFVRISVRDHGIGIQRELLGRIFDPFFTTKAKGHGLGLATSFSIVNRHGGCIDVESEPGKGSVFHIYLPATASPDAAGPSAPVLRHRGSGSILIMDDEPVMRETIADMLKSVGYSVVSTANGAEAVQAFTEGKTAQRPFAGVFLDLTIPGGMGGTEAARKIREIDSSVPLFVASGYAEDPVMAAPADHGFTASLCKPFRKAELAKLLNEHLGSRG
jgi:PAS domain S-box-containing protein